MNKSARFKKGMIFVVLVTFIFAASMVFTNYKNMQGIVEMKGDGIAEKIKSELGALETLSLSSTPLVQEFFVGSGIAEQVAVETEAEVIFVGEGGSIELTDAAKGEGNIIYKKPDGKYDSIPVKFDRNGDIISLTPTFEGEITCSPPTEFECNYFEKVVSDMDVKESLSQTIMEYENAAAAEILSVEEEKTPFTEPLPESPPLELEAEEAEEKPIKKEVRKIIKKSPKKAAAERKAAAEKKGETLQVAAVPGDENYYFLSNGEKVIKVGDKQYVITEPGVFTERIYIQKPDGTRISCPNCKIGHDENGYYIFDPTLPTAQRRISLGEKDPDDRFDKLMEQCSKNINAPECAGVKKIFDERAARVDRHFRSRIEGIFDGLFSSWFDGWLDTRLEYAIYAGICELDYYKVGDRDIDIFMGGTVSAPVYALDLDPYRDFIAVQLGGEKEQLTETKYRYAFTVKIIGETHYIIYLYNSCTGKKSFRLKTSGSAVSGEQPEPATLSEFIASRRGIDDDNDISMIESATLASVEIEGFREEGMLPKKGVHSHHFAGDEMVFDCEKDRECRFNMACVKLIDNEKYPEPYCVELAHGPGFATAGEDLGNKGSFSC